MLSLNPFELTTFSPEGCSYANVQEYFNIRCEFSVGNNSFAVAAFGGEYGGYFAYQIILGTPRMEFYTVLVDPGNGHVLATQKVSAAELEKMHQEHSAEEVQSGGSGIGFPFSIPH